MRGSRAVVGVVSAGVLAVSSSQGAGVAAPAGEHDTFLNAVAPVSKTDAWAVGSTTETGGHYDGLVQRWDGRAWSDSFVYAPAGSDAGGLYAVAVAGDSDVWAVGSYDVHSGDTHASVLHWDGSAWAAVSTAGLHLGWNCQLFGIAALSPSDVWLMGWSYPQHAYKAVPVALHWDGVTLSRVAMPAPPKGQGFISAISAASPSDMWAVGSVMLRGYREPTFIEHWDGTSWSRVKTPNPGALNDLSGVYASGPTTAWAVGSTTGGPLLLRFTGGAWQQVDLPKADASFEFSGIGGTSDDDVWVVGDDRQRDSTATLTLHWDGKHWARVESPTKGNFAVLNGVAAGPRRQTWAVGGHTFKGSDDQRPVRELWTGSEWSMH